MTLVYQAYGREDVIRQTLFSIVSFLRWPRSEKVLVYTDQGDRLRTFFAGHDRVEVVDVTPEQIKTWRGDIDFVHRVKIEILIHAFQKCRDSLLYLDGDTYFIKDPSDMMNVVTPGHHLMHVRESRLDQAADPLTKKIAKFCRRENFDMKRGIISIPLATEMWNAGVIGLHESRANLLDKILDLTDAAYRKYQKHVIEQLAVSYFLQSTGQITAAETWIAHYWQHKELWQARIDAFLAVQTTATKALAHFSQFDFSPPPPAPKRGWWSKLMGSANP